MATTLPQPTTRKNKSNTNPLPELRPPSLRPWRREAELFPRRASSCHVSPRAASRTSSHPSTRPTAPIPARGAYRFAPDRKRKKTDSKPQRFLCLFTYCHWMDKYGYRPSLGGAPYSLAASSCGNAAQRAGVGASSSVKPVAAVTREREGRAPFHPDFQPMLPHPDFEKVSKAPAVVGSSRVGSAWPSLKMRFCLS